MTRIQIISLHDPQPDICLVFEDSDDGPVHNPATPSVNYLAWRNERAMMSMHQFRQHLELQQPNSAQPSMFSFSSADFHAMTTICLLASGTGQIARNPGGGFCLGSYLENMNIPEMQKISALLERHKLSAAFADHTNDWLQTCTPDMKTKRQVANTVRLLLCAKQCDNAEHFLRLSRRLLLISRYPLDGLPGDLRPLTTEPVIQRALTLLQMQRTLAIGTAISGESWAHIFAATRRYKDPVCAAPGHQACVDLEVVLKPERTLLATRFQERRESLEAELEKFTTWSTWQYGVLTAMVVEQFELYGCHACSDRSFQSQDFKDAFKDVYAAFGDVAKWAEDRCQGVCLDCVMRADEPATQQHTSECRIGEGTHPGALRVLTLAMR